MGLTTILYYTEKMGRLGLEPIAHIIRIIFEHSKVWKDFFWDSGNSEEASQASQGSQVCMIHEI